MAIQDITKPMALDETLQAQNSKIDTLNARLLAIAEALGLQSVIGDTDISGIADGTLTGAVAEFDSSKLDVSEVGVAGGVAELDNTGKVPSSQLPSFVDDVLEYASVSAFPATGESGKIYVALDTNKTYRWSGTGYTEISASLALGETSSTAYRGDRGKTAYDHSQDAARVTTATAVGLYKVGATSEGHISGLTPVQKADITALGIPSHDTTYEDATQSVHGLMSTTDKTKLDGISAGANKVEASDTNGNIKIDGTETQVYDDTDIKNQLTTDTSNVTGNPINFSTLSAQNAKSTIIDLDPIQDLHGYDKPWVGGAGKNLLPMILADIKSVNTSGTWSGNVYTYYDVAFTILTDADDNVIGIKATGTPTGTAVLRIIGNTINLPDGSYIMNGCPSGGDWNNKYALNFNYDSEAHADVGSGIALTISSSNQSRVEVLIRNGFAIPTGGLIFYPMIRKSTETDPTFAPYTNIASISGRTEIGILGCGKNILPFDVADLKTKNTTGTWSGDTYTTAGVNHVLNGDKTITVGRVSTSSSWAIFNFGSYTLKAGRYTVSTGFASNDVMLTTRWNNTSGSIIVQTTNGDASFTLSNESVINFTLGFRPTYTGTNILVKPMLYIGDYATSFEPYTKSNDLTISLGQTVYGGTLDVENGVLVVDNAKQLASDLTFEKHPTQENNVYVTNSLQSVIKKPTDYYTALSGLLSNKYETTDWMSLFTAGAYGIACHTDGRVIVADPSIEDITEWGAVASSIEIVYPLATPITINLTPHQISLLEGVNNISTTGDKITLTYRDGKVATLGDLTNAVDNLDSKIDESKILTDTATGDKYILVVTNGVLSVEQISN